MAFRADAAAGEDRSTSVDTGMGGTLAELESSSRRSRPPRSLLLLLRDFFPLGDELEDELDEAEDFDALDCDLTDEPSPSATFSPGSPS